MRGVNKVSEADATGKSMKGKGVHECMGDESEGGK